MSFPERFIEELLARNDIVDVVGSYISLNKRGGDYWACCPFHNEKTPSFSVVPDKGFYYCFGCKKGGTAIQFVMEIENLPYGDAVRFLAKRAGLEIPEESGDREEIRRRDRILKLNRDAALFYYDLLKSPEGGAAREYLNKRRISWKTAVKFGMGAAVNQSDRLLKAMTEKGYNKQELIDAGLVKPDKNGILRDKFRDRLMLPVIDIQGNVAAFGSRILDNNNFGPKYMNSPDLPYRVYSKRKILYALNLARKTKRKNMILCEGNLDVVTLYQAGFDNAIASMGTALTPEQIKLIGRYTKELVLCYDNDAAGDAATEKALKLLDHSKLKVRVLRLPNKIQDGKPVKQDPDDFIKNYGADAFERLLNQSELGVAFRMNQIAAKYDLKSDEGRSSYGQEISKLIAGLDNQTQQGIYINRAAEIGGLDVEAFEHDIRRIVDRWNPYQRQETVELSRIKYKNAHNENNNESNQSHENNGDNGNNWESRFQAGQSGQVQIERARRDQKRGSYQIGPLEQGEITYQQYNPAIQRKRDFGYEDVKLARAEEGIVAFLLLYPELFPNEIGIYTNDFSVPLLRKAFEILWNAKKQGSIISPLILDDVLSPEEISRITELSHNPTIAQNREKALRDYINIIRQESEKRKRMDNPGADELEILTRKYKNRKK